MTAVTSNLRAFAHEHDDIPAFHAAYLVCTFLTAAIFNSGFFAGLIAIHMSLDYVKYRDVHGFGLAKTIRGMLLESIVDIALLMLSLTFAVTLNHTYMLAALSGLLRSELTLVRAIGTIIPRIQILEHFLSMAFNIHSYMNTVHPSLDRKLTRLERVAFWTIVVCASMLVLVAVLFRGNEQELLNIFARELIPRF